MPLPVFEAVILSKGKLNHHICQARDQFCVPCRPYLPKCFQSTRDYNSQNSSCQQHTQLPPRSALGKYKGHTVLPGARVWVLSVQAPQG